MRRIHVASIQVLVIDPRLRRVYERSLASGLYATQPLVGARAAAHYGLWPGHALDVRAMPDTGLPAWQLRLEGREPEVFHGCGVLYAVQAVGRVDHQLSRELVYNAVYWMSDEQAQEQEPGSGGAGG